MGQSTHESEPLLTGDIQQSPEMPFDTRLAFFLSARLIQGLESVNKGDITEQQTALISVFLARLGAPALREEYGEGRIFYGINKRVRDRNGENICSFFLQADQEKRLPEWNSGLPGKLQIDVFRSKKHQSIDSQAGSTSITVKMREAWWNEDGKVPYYKDIVEVTVAPDRQNSLQVNQYRWSLNGRTKERSENITIGELVTAFPAFVETIESMARHTEDFRR